MTRPDPLVAHLTRHGHRVVLAACLLAALGAGPAPAAPVFDVSGAMSDFSQHQNASWSNYCAPTSAANLAYFFGQDARFGGLLQGNPVGPGTTADTGATGIIGGTGAPPPPTGSLADLMNTSLTNGTTGTDLRDGLDLYLETNDGNPNFTWDTSLLMAADVGGTSFWADIRTALETGAGVILLIDWPPTGTGSPPPTIGEEQEYDLPMNRGILPGDPIAHAVTFTGFDLLSNPAVPQMSFHDPGNNLGSGHLWAGEAGTTDGSSVSIGASDLQITIASTTASVYGAVLTEPIPEPSTALLLGMGLAGIAARQRRRARAAAAGAAGAASPQPR